MELIYFHSRKCICKCLRNSDHFVSASMCWPCFTGSGVTAPLNQCWWTSVGPIIPTLILIRAWLSNHLPVKWGTKLVIQSHTSTATPLKSGNVYIILFHILSWWNYLFMLGLKSIHISKETTGSLRPHTMHGTNFEHTSRYKQYQGMWRHCRIIRSC